MNAECCGGKTSIWRVTQRTTKLTTTWARIESNARCAETQLPQSIPPAPSLSAGPEATSVKLLHSSFLTVSLSTDQMSISIIGTENNTFSYLSCKPLSIGKWHIHIKVLAPSALSTLWILQYFLILKGASIFIPMFFVQHQNTMLIVTRFILSLPAINFCSGYTDSIMQWSTSKYRKRRRNLIERHVILIDVAYHQRARQNQGGHLRGKWKMERRGKSNQWRTLSL